MATLVKLSGKGSSIVFSHATDLKSVATALSLSLLAGSRGPLDTFGQYYKNNPINPYPTEQDANTGDFLVDVSQTPSNTWQIKTEKVTGRNPYGGGILTVPSQTYNGINDFLDSFKPKTPPAPTFEVNGMYIFNYAGGSKPGAERFVKVVEVDPTSILTDDLAAGAPRRFNFRDISNVRKVG